MPAPGDPTTPCKAIRAAYRAPLQQLLDSATAHGCAPRRATVTCARNSGPSGTTAKPESTGTATLEAVMRLARSEGLTADAAEVTMAAGAEGAPRVNLERGTLQQFCARAEARILISKSADAGISVAFAALVDGGMTRIRGIGIDYVSYATGLALLESCSNEELASMFRADELRDATRVAEHGVRLSQPLGQFPQDERGHIARLRYLLVTFALKEAAFKSIGEAFSRCAYPECIESRAGFMDFEVRAALLPRQEIVPRDAMADLMSEIGLTRLQATGFAAGTFAGALCFAT